MAVVFSSETLVDFFLTFSVFIWKVSRFTNAFSLTALLIFATIHIFTWVLRLTTTVCIILKCQITLQFFTMGVHKITDMFKITWNILRNTDTFVSLTFIFTVHIFSTRSCPVSTTCCALVLITIFHTFSVLKRSKKFV